VSGAFACEAARSRRVLVCGLELHLLEWGQAARSGVLLHHLVLDRPEAFVRELRDFLDGLDAGGAGASASGRPFAS
jgi:hypothetical protein